ncbi:unnamed protein product [Arctogadus glacialis]
MEDVSLALLSLPSSPLPSATENDFTSMSQSNRPPRSQGPEHTLKPGLKEVCDGEERFGSAEDNFSHVSESMSVTSGDQEKLLLLNKNTELRRVNQELMKLNEEWDRVYRHATADLQQRLESLVQETAAAKQLNKRLLLKVENQQSTRDYYEQSLLQEQKKNQDLQDYIRQLEGRRAQKHANTARTAHTDRTADQQGLRDFVHIPEPTVSPSSDIRATPAPQSSSYGSGSRPQGGFHPSSSSSYASCFSPFNHPEAGPPDMGTQYRPDGDQDLKEQLQALRCQTQIYEAEFQTEHKDHKNTLQENRRLRRKREEMRQQVALLQEQLKVYEDDFRKERSDKQVLQRLLGKKNSPTKDAVLVHRCNNEQKPPGGDKGTHSGERAQGQNHPHCPNQCYIGTLSNENLDY